jgi:hypothetical protein
MWKGLPTGTDLQISELESFGEELYKDGTLASLLVEPERNEEFYEILKAQRQQVLERIKNNANRLLDATAIVFAHGILDAGVYGYLVVLSQASPDSFRLYTDSKQVSLSDVESKSYGQLLKEKIEKFMEEKVERGSLIYKLDKIHEITQPTDTQMNPSHKYDRDKLDAFDKARHDIVHGNKWGNYQINFAAELIYWGLLNFYLLRLVSHKTGLRLSQEGGQKYMLGE